MMKKFFALVLMLMTLLISSTTFAFSVFHPADGIYSLQPQCAPGKELSVENHGTNWGANVIIDNINSGWRKWKIQRIEGSDFYSIIAVHSNLALDVANARAEDGVNIATWPFLNDKQNRFRFLDAGNGYYVIQADIGGNFVVDVFNRENRAGTNVWSYGFNGTPAQLWRLVKVQNLSTFQSYSKKATQKVTAYVMPNLQARSGNEYVSAGDNVTVLREEGNAYLVRYPVRNDTKTRWVDKREIFKGSYDRIVMQSTHDPQGRIEQVDSPSPGVLHVRGTAHDPDNHLGSTRLHVYVGGNTGSGAPGYEIRTDGNSRIFDDTRKVDRTGKQHVYIYALNDYGSGNNVEIWNGYVNIQGNNPTPNGYLWPIKSPTYDNYTINTLYYYSDKHYDKTKNIYRYEHSTWYERYTGGNFYSIDVKAAMNTEVVAVANGTVIKCEDRSNGEAKYVKIKHDSTESLYAHLNRIDVREGQAVSAGQVIGLSGDTGAKGAPHLHFEFSNMNAFKYYRDKYPLHYRVWIRNAYNNVKNSIGENNRKEFEEAINWINAHGGFIN